MSGLDKIISTIEEKADLNAKAIIAQAEQKALAIKEDGAKKADEAYNEIIAAANKQCEKELAAAVSLAQSEKSRGVLKAKSQCIEAVIRSVIEKTGSLCDEDYFDIISKLIMKNFHTSAGEIIFGDKDKKRLPKGFIADINRALGEKGASLTLSDETAGIENGFILRYGDIEENCTFDSLVYSDREIIRDEIAAVLFGN